MNLSSLEKDRGRDVWFEPAHNITALELAQILRLTIFMSSGAEFGGSYELMSPELQRHFLLQEPRK